MKSKKLAWAAAGILCVLAVTSTTVSAHRAKPAILHPRLGIAPVNTYVVTKTTDSGDNTNAAPGTLRRALVDANNHAGFDLIVFDLQGSGVKTITVKNYLPDLTDNAGVMIDGTQSDDRIEIDGSQVVNHHGIPIVSNNNVIKGLIINGVQGGGAGIGILKGASGNAILGNSIGTNAAGNAAKGNHSGVYISPDSNGNYVGGTEGVSPGGACTGDCNVISGNRYHGVVIDRSSNNVVVGNFIGLNANGSGIVGNGDDGVLLGNASNNRVGGPTPQERNVIAGSYNINVELGDTGTHHNTVQGNFIGLNSAGNARLTNNGSGIVIDLGAHDNTIDGNVIGAHRKFGILVFKNAVRTTITNNRIGVGAFNNTNLGNKMKGIEVQTNNNRILNNVSWFNGSDGIRVKSGTGNLISQNSTWNNDTFGINLGTDAFSENDTGDGDGGANLLQNFPTLKEAIHDGTSLSVTGNLNSRPNARFTLEFFHNPQCDLTFGHSVGEGKQYLGSTVVTTNGSGSAGFSVSLGGAPTSGVVTGTATDSSNNTSEFSYCREIAQGEPTPPAPQLLSPSNGESVPNNPPRLDWSASNYAAYYKVILRDGGTKGPKVHVNSHVEDDQYTPPQLPGGKTYYWRIVACNNYNSCSKSVWFNFSVP